MLGSLFRPEPLDPARPPPGVHPEEWAIYVPRERRHRAIVRGVLGLLLLLPLAWVGWRLANPPPAAPAHHASAAQLFERGNARAALAEVRSALLEDPDLADARQLAGRIHLHMGAYADAVKELRRAQALGLASPQLDVELATALLRDGKPDAVLALLGTSSLETRNPAEALALRGAAQRLRGEAALAERDFEAALQNDVRNVRALRGLARLALEAGRVADAGKQVDRALEHGRRNEDNWQLKGDVEWASGEAALAEDAYRTASELNPFRPEAHAGLARALLAQQELDLAALEVETLGDIAPRAADTWYLRGELARHRAELTAAVDAWQQALKIDPAHGEAQFGLGRVLAQRGQHEQAMEWLGRYVAAHPLDVAGVTAFARLALDMGAAARALEALAAIPRAALTDPDLLALLGTAALDTPPTVAAPYVEQILAARASP